MVQIKEGCRRNMVIFQGDSTQKWTILVKSPWDGQMAAISKRMPFAQATNPARMSFGPVYRPFGRLKRPVYGFTAIEGWHNSRKGKDRDRP